ncbi:TPA: hypothetical protein ACT9MM_001437 [Legionella pneumophila]|nr:hypothetical protein [Legionella pneumophila]HAT8831243.1 hypothetical protein [Legionella pneumophila subsp. pneumophila]HAU1834076.1 hypothetical protein [Legionella pneumophila]
MSIWNFMHPSDDEKKVIEALKNSSSKTMDVVGRGTLVMDAKEVTRSEKYKKLLANAEKILSK